MLGLLSGCQGVEPVRLLRIESPSTGPALSARASSATGEVLAELPFVAGEVRLVLPLARPFTLELDTAGGPRAVHRMEGGRSFAGCLEGPEVQLPPLVQGCAPDPDCDALEAEKARCDLECRVPQDALVVCFEAQLELCATLDAELQNCLAEGLDCTPIEMIYREQCLGSMCAPEREALDACDAQCVLLEQAYVERCIPQGIMTCDPEDEVYVVSEPSDTYPCGLLP